MVSKKHSYADVVGVSLTEHKTLCIRYLHDHDFVYYTPVRQPLPRQLRP